MEEEIFLKAEDIIDYVRDNVKTHDILEISYNRIYAPGEVLGVEIEEEYGEEFLEVTLHLNGDLVNQIVRINMHAIKDDLIEIRHTQGEELKVLVAES
ncbi:MULTISPECIES: DUF2097 domain-containing protein [Methanobacterium]|jgi:hypothetical protein|uniref:DUF2097 domain-containing protein n=1 Tax=Methanobacterium formicicum TaxID=2162 RepID=A0A090JWC3_METFO|nr:MULTISPECIES: DUF2097 domain-containing protein [Methanobacterium]AIS31009.1 hypothetical protein BRM9_0180 [Methanobacterium formicicum]MDG3546893.1 DUF2097 domain-containing protein [Methanobacterium formicicum]MDH2660567.1 DUF2097 domain-containing protein [Methanobacterium formicicum]CEA13831.1 hypothetical protein DSM1535_1498 [Methanobacterium formicicum]CEL23801.1 hypothetical protein MB9_0145 [Methanobacterium formicicum]